MYPLQLMVLGQAVISLIILGTGSFIYEFSGDIVGRKCTQCTIHFWKHSTNPLVLGVWKPPNTCEKKSDIDYIDLL